MGDRVRERIREIIREHTAPGLGQKVTKELDRIVAG